jgi:CRISPR subtype II RNA-guided endonuclease Cas9/Csn1
MTNILGLDIGTNSIGWTLLEKDEKIIGSGVVIFPIGTNVDEKGREKTKNQQRREYRSAKRLLFRYKMRRIKLQKLLAKIGLLPKYNEDGSLIKTYRVKNAFQGKELYRLRTQALDQRIEPEDIGRIFLLMNKYRGFKSGSKTILEDEEAQNEDEGKIKSNIHQLTQFLQESDSRTVGEYYYKMYCKASELHTEGKWHNPEEPFDERAVKNGIHNRAENRGIRREFGRHTARWMNEKEFDLIWSAQKKKHYKTSPAIFTGSKEEYDILKEKIQNLPREERRKALTEFKQSNYWQIKYATIFYQRPLKSPKKYIGKCLFEKNKRSAPISSFLYQEFRIWKQLSDIRYSEAISGKEDFPMPNEWKKTLYEYLQINPKLYLKGKTLKGKKYPGICDVLELNPKLISFNFDNEEEDKQFKGNVTKSTLYQALGEALYFLLDKKAKLEKLWHLIYMKRDDEWLFITLNDKSLWPELNDEVAQKLCEISFEDGYGAYSSKAIKKLLPFMCDGKDEFDAEVLAGYKQAPDEVKEDWKPKEKVTQLQTGELRNPVVEKAVTQTIKLVNALLAGYTIDKERWIIRIESTRELKKPKKDRENLRRENTEKDKLRQEYADFLNQKRKEGKLSTLKKEVNKFDNVINKLELWLEMGGDKDDVAFEEFSKASQINDSLKRTKYKLWLECNRICPYTGKPISLSEMLSSAVEIEHILPLSRSLDNSFTNKTLTFSSVNREKRDRTSHEFMKESIKEFKKRIKNARYSSAKIENFLRESVPQEFSHAQLGNTSYIAKFVRRKLQEVCKDVYFTNGRVTGELRSNDWRLSSLLDKIRYEELTGIDIDKDVLQPFSQIRKDFNQYRSGVRKEPIWKKAEWATISEGEFEEYKQRTGNDLKYLILEIEKFEIFRGERGKKDRSDHRHHALDALVIACCSPSITQKLSTLNARREEMGIGLYDEYGQLTREPIQCPVEYAEIKKSLKNILVVHKTAQRLIVATKNSSKKKKGIEGKGTVLQKSHSVRASLHKDTLYGKLKNPALHVDNKGNQLIDKPEAYITREKNYVWEFNTEKSLEAIYDRDLKEIIKRRLTLFKEKSIPVSEQSYLQYPLYRYSPDKYPDNEPENPVSIKKGMPLPIIKKVRTVYKNYRSIISLPNNRYADADGNYIMAIYELREKDKKGKEKVIREFIIRSTYEAVDMYNKKEKLFPDILEKEDKFLPLMQGCSYLKQGDLVVMYEDDNDKENIDWEDPADLKRRLYIINGLSSMLVSGKYEYGVISLVKHNCSKSNAKFKKGLYSNSTSEPFIENLHSQIKAVKIKLNNLGIPEMIDK